MPLNMNTIGTGTGIGGGSGNGESVYGSPDTAIINNSTKFNMSTVKVGKSIKTIYSPIYNVIGNDGTYMYDNYSAKLTRHKMTVNTNNTFDDSGYTTTVLISGNCYGAVMVDKYIYYLNDSSANTCLYKYNIETGTRTQLLNTSFDTTLNWSTSYQNNGGSELFSYSHIMLDGSVYFVYMCKSSTYSSDQEYQVLLVRDNPSSGCSVIGYSQSNSTLNFSNAGTTWSNTSTSNKGFDRVWAANNENIGIVNIVDDGEYYNVYFGNLYMYLDGYTYGSLWNRTFALYRDKWKMQIGKSTHTVALTQVSSDKLDSVKASNTIKCLPYSYPRGTTLYITAGDEIEYVSTSIYYGGYFGNVYVYHDEKDSYDITKITSRDISEMTSHDDDGKFESNSTTATWAVYPCKYRDILIITYKYNSDNDASNWSYVYPIDFTKTLAGTDGVYTKVTWMFNKGDTIICDSGILSYTYNSTTKSVNNTSYRVTTAGLYEFRLKLKTAGEQSSFIIKTSGGAIVCPGIKFVDNTHISGYFIKGLKINGTEITTSGYQTVTGTFNGRVTISK
nr:MAG TPA: hypothetical protein [Caudoviricetes sp.]